MFRETEVKGMFDSIKRHKTIIILSAISMLPIAFGASNMTSDMLDMMVEIMPIMLIVMVFKMLATSMGGS